MAQLFIASTVLMVGCSLAATPSILLTSIPTCTDNAHNTAQTHTHTEEKGLKLKRSRYTLYSHVLRHTIQLIYTASIWGAAKNKMCNAILLMQINNSYYIKRFRVEKKTLFSSMFCS